MFIRECDVIEIKKDYVESAIMGVEDWFLFGEDWVYTFPYCDKYGFDRSTMEVKRYSSSVIRRLFNNGLLRGEKVLVINPYFSQGVDEQLFIPNCGGQDWKLSGDNIMSTYSVEFRNKTKKYVSGDGVVSTELHWLSGLHFDVNGDDWSKDLMQEISRYIEDKNIGFVISCGRYFGEIYYSERYKDNECVNYLIDNLLMRFDFSNNNRKVKFLRFSNTRL